MPCYHPLKAYKSTTVSATGKRFVVFNRRAGHPDLPITIPCGWCIGCRIERTREWAIRCTHEAQMHNENCFITLTYSPQWLPVDYSLDIKHFQNFMKRLRKSVAPKKIRFYHCGEYGENLGRPHYHALIFGHDFNDKKPWKKSRENMVYTSEKLQELWPLGFSSLGAVTFQSSAYVARYLMKKITGKNAAQHYQWTDPRTGQVHQRSPEYTTMSNRPGIGHSWLQKYASDVYPSNYLVLNSKRMTVPRYYTQLLKNFTPKQQREIRMKTFKEGKKHPEEQTKERLNVREKVQNARLEQLPRKEL